jgi:hypothetical protein
MGIKRRLNENGYAKMKRIIVTPVFFLGDLLHDPIFINCSLGYNGNINLFFAEKRYDYLKSRKVKNMYPVGAQPDPPGYRTVKNFKIRPQTPQNYRLIIPEENRVMEFNNKSINYTHALQIDPGKYCFICNSTHDSFKNSLDKNCQMTDSKGEVIDEFTLGTGINDVQTDSKGQLWVSYGDIGIYGGFLDEDTIGRKGLNCFDANGNITYRHDGSPVIDSCDSLNVCSDNEVVINIYSGSVETWFAFVKIANKKIEKKLEWRESAKFMAFSGNLALVEERSRDRVIKSTFLLVNIEKYGKEDAVFEFYNSNNEELNCVHAQKDALFFWKKKMLYKINIDELLHKI